jgi:hypothetical protein
MKKYPFLMHYIENDEYYTPPILVELILPYVKKNSTIWCPFDTAESEFVIHLKKEGHTVIHTHIIDGYDFFELMAPECDYIISNPPFSRKQDIFKRLFKMGIPFAMLMNVQILNHHETGDLFKDYDFELLLPNKRISYDGNRIPFLSGYFCYKMLPKQLKYVSVEHTNIGRHFVPSRMLKTSS